MSECKATGSELSVGEVERFADLGRRLDGSRVVYAMPTDFDGVADVIERARQVSAPMEVEVWEDEELVDPPRIPKGYIEPGGDDDFRPEPDEYLRRLVLLEQRRSNP